MKDDEVKVVTEDMIRKYIRIEGFKFEFLARSPNIEMIRTTIEPGSKGKPYSHKGEECTYVIEGKLDVEVDGVIYHLKEGDSIWHKSKKLHKWENNSDKIAKVISISYPVSYLSLTIAKL